MEKIRLPNNFIPRDYQIPLWDYFENGGTRAVAVWHRRAGKDASALNITACKAFERVGVYWHLLPHYAQARKVIWDAIDPVTGGKLIDQAFPKELRAQTYKQEMKIELKSGSLWQLAGSDNVDTLVGAPPVGVVFSDFAR